MGAKSILSLLLMAGLLVGCASKQMTQRELLVQAVGFDGTLHYTLPLSDESANKLDAQIADAREDLKENPTDEMALIWYGRRLSYAGLYQQAVVNYTRGLQLHPDSFKLRRHRGHRFITLRLLRPALDDLARAESLSRNIPNAVEPDGMPNAAGIPLSTTRGNILYHLALAYYLSGSYADAARTWQEALDIARNDDSRVSCTYWLLLCEAKLGEKARVAELLSTVTPDMSILENDQYHQLLLYFKGDLAEDVLLGNAAASGAVRHEPLFA